VFDQLTGPARRAVLLAFREAKRCQHDFLGTEHLLFGLLCDTSSPVVGLLRNLQRSPEAILARVEQRLHRAETGAALERFPLSPAVKRVLDGAAQEAGLLGHLLTGPEHLLLGLLREPMCEAAQVLAEFDVDAAAVRRLAAQLPPAEALDHLVREEARLAFPPASAEPTPEALQALAAVAAVQVEETPAPANLAKPSPLALSEGHPRSSNPDLIQHAAELEGQLRATQLLLGGVLGFYLGHLLGGWEFGVLLGLGGLAVAALRSSALGAWMGFIGGVMVPMFAPDFDDTWNGARLLVGCAGALLGSFLGDFWRRLLAKKAPGDE